MLERKEFKIKVIDTKVSMYKVFADSPRMAEGYQEAGKTKFLAANESRRMEISELREKKKEE